MLAGCAASTPFANRELSIKPVLKAAPAELAAKCTDPVVIPEGPKVQHEVESLWSIDRASLVDCRDRKAAEGGYYHKRDTELTR